MSRSRKRSILLPTALLATREKLSPVTSGRAPSRPSSSNRAWWAGSTPKAWMCPASTAAVIVSATVPGPGRLPVVRLSNVARASDSSVSTRSAFSAKARYCSRSRKSAAVSAVSGSATPGTAMGPVKFINAASPTGSTAMTPSTGCPLDCGYSSAMTCPTLGKSGDIVMLRHVEAGSGAVDLVPDAVEPVGHRGDQPVPLDAAEIGVGRREHRRHLAERGTERTDTLEVEPSSLDGERLEVGVHGDVRSVP